MGKDKKKEERDDDDENEIAVALVAECKVGSKTYRAGETWTDDENKCHMSICNPGGVVSVLECPRFETTEGEGTIRIPGDNKYAYPHCCDYVFLAKKKEEEESDDTAEEKEEEAATTATATADT